MLGFFSIVIATICGLYSGARPNSLIGRTIYWLSSLGLNIPIYWLSILMMYVFGVLLKWLPIMNNQTWQAYLLPIIALTISEVLSMTLYIHSLLKQSNQQPYMQAIQTRGIKQRYIWFYYYFRSILFPLLILFTQGLIHLFGHVVLVENVFSIPGIGRYLLEAMGRRDIPVIQGITLIIGIVIFILFGIIDGLNQLIDPRSRFKREEQILDEET